MTGGPFVPHALVTGASSGIGRAVAAELAARGMRCTLVARRRDRLEEFAASSTFSGRPEPTVRSGDLLDDTFVSSLCDEFARDGAVPDVLVNNAAFGSNRPFLACDVERLDALTRLDLEVPVKLCRALGAGMARRGSGMILNVASIAGFIATPFHAHYSATKAALILFSEALDLEVRTRGVTVSCLCPGLTDTEFFSAGQYATTSPIYRMRRADPAAVARRAVIGMLSGRRLIVPGVANRAMLCLARLVPTSLVVRLAGRLMRTER